MLHDCHCYYNKAKLYKFTSNSEVKSAVTYTYSLLSLEATAI